jgi:hypothetical protein
MYLWRGNQTGGNGMILHRTELDFNVKYNYASPVQRRNLNPEYYVVHNMDILKLSVADIKSFIQQATELLVQDGHYDTEHAPSRYM